MNAGRWVTNLLGKPAANPLPPIAAPAPRRASGVEHAARDVVARLVPGTELRDGIDRILRARTGALLVLGYDEAVERICDGGFDLDVEFSPTRLRELSKMDGAVVLSTDGGRIRRANVHLVPDPLLPTSESGTRHKAAERTAAQTGYPVVSVSRSTGIVTVYARGSRHLIQPSETILARANQAMATLERYRSRLDETTRQLTVVELGDVVTVRDVLTVVHCLELVRRVAREIESDVNELGVDGRQLALQLAEVVGNAEGLRRLVVRDYLRPVAPGGVAETAVEHALDALDQLLEVELLELTNLAPPLGFPATIEALDAATSARGYRLLAEIPRVPRPRAEALVTAFGSLSALLAAEVAELAAIEGIDDELARRIRERLARPE
ncbi:DNA integrity scanning diadenylate cyclase DisA [Nocardia sp. CDC159]|uniref:DNA integrity scanning diadenylate cyclase DisA n=1 Tax=Nocardia pulmonis TaxID=2951408 RepID=A0A9X2IUF9_9NOCA|nr:MULTISPECIES: DNA integrity scanning diadenylate cyclase DisA [Nocardia]MCM6772837.1 DNA integrity scanning diadenylate cyclase DisA [Nocardia pulmonis]MCM6785860.1 DNA integrity scanning diadenylate cyclase DisA [Nocardia sp. CDC159]